MKAVVHDKDAGTAGQFKKAFWPPYQKIGKILVMQEKT